ncbi:MAG TPA: FtsX-like permease family protein [Polyangiaceae bacterium]|jgi:putative ABC transport system permease protein|nr:FtsX-like permease family protein [Polyangiaceae bacterium]
MIPISYNVRSLFVRKTTTFATAFGIGLVVFVLASALMLSAGIEKTLVAGGRADQAIVLRKGSDTELASSIETTTVSLIQAAPGVKKDPSGAPLVAGEVVIVLALDKIDGGGQIANVQFRGIPEASLKVRTDAHVIAGRPPTPGTNEVIIGKGLVGHFKGMELNGQLELKKNRPVKVVGVFEAGGSSFESEVWVDVDVMRGAFGREGLVSSVIVRLDSPLKFDGFKATMESDKRLGLEAFREAKYFENQSSGTSIFVSMIGGVITFFFSLGAIIGAIITMYAAVAQRRREIGTLRALGFSQASILFSFLFEAVVLATVGGLLGIAGALLMSFTKISMMNFATWQEITFSFDPNPKVLLIALLGGCIMGVLGGFFPAVRAARVAPVEAIRG